MNQSTHIRSTDNLTSLPDGRYIVGLVRENFRIIFHKYYGRYTLESVFKGNDTVVNDIKIADIFPKFMAVMEEFTWSSESVFPLTLSQLVLTPCLIHWTREVCEFHELKWTRSGENFVCK